MGDSYFLLTVFFFLILEIIAKNTAQQTYEFFKIHETALKTVEKSDSEWDKQVTSHHTKHQCYQVNNGQLKELLANSSLPAKWTYWIKDTYQRSNITEE